MIYKTYIVYQTPKAAGPAHALVHPNLDRVHTYKHPWGPWGANVGAETNYPPGGCLACADRLSRTLRRVGSCAESSHCRRLTFLVYMPHGCIHSCCSAHRYELRTHSTNAVSTYIRLAGRPDATCRTSQSRNRAPTSPQSSGPDGSSRVRVKLARAGYGSMWKCDLGGPTGNWRRRGHRASSSKPPAGLTICRGRSTPTATHTSGTWPAGREDTYTTPPPPTTKAGLGEGLKPAAAAAPGPGMACPPSCPPTRTGAAPAPSWRAPSG